MPASALPTGTVTFLFTDIEGSTRLVERLGTDAWTPLLEAHRVIIREALAAEDGHEIRTEGDAFFAAFASAPRGVAAAARAQRGLAAYAWPQDAVVRVRMGLHTGEGTLSPTGDYIGLDVHRAARVAAAGHGGQVLLSATTSALAAGALPAGVTLRDLGEHRLRDLSAPERLAELLIEGLPVEHPRLRTLDAIPNNLPVQLTSFVGREREVGEAVALLGRVRLLTLTGPGGTGKTRLGLQVAAAAVDHFPDGVYFVALSAIREPDHVLSAIAQVLGLPDTGQRPLAERLAELLRGRTTLLALDNFEQVLGAGPAVAELLRAAPQLKVLVTSRAALRVSGEQEYPVPALDLPDPAHLPPLAALSHYEAVALFIQRAVAVEPGFVVTNENAPAVAEICASLDGLPLAIELAAARIRLLSPQQILARLGSRLDLLSAGSRDLPDRQRTLRGAIAWSWELLDQPSRALMARLAVFVDGASYEAIEPVCDPDRELGIDLLDGLESLVGHSLLRRQDKLSEPRFVMLETIRDFAAERLATFGDPKLIHERHARYFCRLARQAEPQLMSSDKRRWLDLVEREQDNMRAALDWAVAGGQVELALQMVSALWRFWQMRGHLAEGSEQAARALALPGWEPFTEARLGALDAAGGIAYWQADMATAGRHYRQSLELQRQRGDRRAVAEARYNLAMSQIFDAVTDEAAHQAALDEAETMATQSLEGFRELGDRGGEGRALWALGNVETDRRRFDRATDYLREALERFRAEGDDFMIGWCLYSLGGAAFLSGDDATAQTVWAEALRIFVPTDDISATVMLVDAYGWMAWRQGDRERSLRLAGFADALESSTGTGLGSLNRIREGLVNVEDARKDPTLAAAYEAGRRLSRAEAVALALGEPASSGPAAA
jgi:predicted ATPase/class 3 adenylate cyclase